MEANQRGGLLPLITAGALLLLAIGLGVVALSPDAETQTAEDGIVSEASGRVEAVTYQSATVYAGSTDFYFENSDGEVVEFRVSNLPDSQSIELPDDMLESDVIEGPPGPNPELVGQNFLLIYDDQDELLRVEHSR